MLIFILGVVVGAVLDNIFAPKFKFEDGSISVKWNNDKTKKP